MFITFPNTYLTRLAAMDIESEYYISNNNTQFNLSLPTILQQEDIVDLDKIYLRATPNVPYAAHLALGIFMIPVTLIAVGGNALVIWVFIR